MEVDFQTQMQVLAQALERSAQIQESSVAAHAALVQTLQSSSSSTSASSTGERRREIKPLPAHYIYRADPTESFTDHIEKLKCIRALQGLNEDEFFLFLWGL